MGKKTDHAKANEIIRHGFALPAEIENFFKQAKARAVSSMLKARADAAQKLREFKANADALYAALPEDKRIVHDYRYGKGWFTRPLTSCEFYCAECHKIQKMYPYYGWDDQRAVKCEEEACDFKRIQFIIRTNGITGDEITACALQIDPASGDVNGTITGKAGTANVKTIGAGGYNIQCYHFRCLIREVK